MKKLTALATIILSLSSYAYAENLSAENKAFIESMIKKEFPHLEYDTDNFSLWIDFKQLDLPEGDIAAMVINNSLGVYGSTQVYLYELKRINNKWNIETKSMLENEHEFGEGPLGNGEVAQLGSQKLSFDFDMWLGNGGVTQLGSKRLGFELIATNFGSGGSNGTTEWIYTVNGKYKHLTGCFTEQYRGNSIDIACEPTIRKDLPETDGFYPIELNYSLFKYQVKNINYLDENIPEGWSWQGGDDFKKWEDEREGAIIVTFDSTKQAYVLPAGFVKAFKSDNRQEALWNYFGK